MQIIQKCKLQTAKKRSKKPPEKVGGVNSPHDHEKNHRFCCFRPRPISPENEDRIQHAFRKWIPNSLKNSNKNTAHITCQILHNKIRGCANISPPLL